MADNNLTNPHPELGMNPDYWRSRILAAYWYRGLPQPSEGDYTYWTSELPTKGGWNGYWWDKLTINQDTGQPEPVVNPTPVDPSYGRYVAGPNPYNPHTDPQPVPQPLPSPTPDLLTALAALEAKIDQLANKPAPAYTGSIWGIKVVLRPA